EGSRSPGAPPLPCPPPGPGAPARVLPRGPRSEDTFLRRRDIDQRSPERGNSGTYVATSSDRVDKRKKQRKHRRTTLAAYGWRNRNRNGRQEIGSASFPDSTPIIACQS